MTEIIWNIICTKCKQIRNFKEVTGLEFRDFCKVLRKECPECGKNIELIIQNDTLYAICKHCFFEKKISNLNNLDEKYLNDKMFGFIYISPKCPSCGARTRRFVDVV